MGEIHRATYEIASMPGLFTAPYVQHLSGTPAPGPALCGAPAPVLWQLGWAVGQDRCQRGAHL